MPRACGSHACTPALQVRTGPTRRNPLRPHHGQTQKDNEQVLLFYLTIHLRQATAAPGLRVRQRRGSRRTARATPGGSPAVSHDIPATTSTWQPRVRQRLGTGPEYLATTRVDPEQRPASSAVTWNASESSTATRADPELHPAPSAVTRNVSESSTTACADPELHPAPSAATRMRLPQRPPGRKARRASAAPARTLGSVSRRGAGGSDNSEPDRRPCTRLRHAPTRSHVRLRPR